MSESKKQKKDHPEDVSILRLDLKGDFVTLINKGTHAVKLENWQLKSVTGSQEFTFPKDTTLHPGGTITVWSGKESDHKNNPPISFGWTKQYIWNDKGDTAQIVNPKGKIIQSVEEKPPKQEHHTITIEELDLRGEFVTLMNRSNKDIKIGGWILKSLVGSQGFVFPSDTLLQAGCTVTVWSGRESDGKDHPPNSFAWTKKYIWNDKGDTAALYNSDGDLVVFKQEVPIKVPDHVNPSDIK